MPRIKSLLVLVALMSAPGLALAAGQAEPPKWGYIEAGWIDFSPDDLGSVDLESDDGAFAGASIGLGKNFHILAEYDDVGDYTFWNAGFGWHGLFGDKADLYAQAVWANIDIDNADISEDGYELQAGVRWKLIRWFELKLQANWVDYGGDFSSDTTGEVGALFVFFKDRMGIGADWAGGGDADTSRVFLRFNFGK